MKREEAKERIKTGIDCREYLQKAPKGGYICPFCGSGTGNNHAGRQATGGVKYYENTNTFYCHACGKGGDVLDLVRIAGGLDYNAAFSLLADRLHLDVDQRPAGDAAAKSATTTTATAKTPETGAQSKTEAARDFTEYYELCAGRLTDPAAVSYLKARGISTKTAARCGIGYDPQADPASAPGAIGNEYKPHPAPRLIIPTGAGHYVGRRIDGETDFAKINAKGTTPGLFNADALNAQEVQGLFVTEGAFDALAVIEAGFSAVALNSVNNINAFLKAAEAAGVAGPVIIALDNDKAGRAAAAELAEGLDALNIPNWPANIAGRHNDPGDAWTADPDAFKHACNSARSGNLPNTADYVRYSLAAEVKNFKSDYKTGFQKLDQEAGGLYSGLYVLAAVSSLGKTSFALQIADQIAEQGGNVLFFSLEQSQFELVTKSISRQTAKDSETTHGDHRDAVTSLQIRKGNESKAARIAAREYINNVGGRVSIIEGNFRTDVFYIKDKIKEYIKKTGRRPVVFVDYLQIIQPPEGMARAGVRENTDANITELKRISRDLDITVIVISSVNRGNYLTPIDFESLKESGGIEYAADVVFGLQFSIVTAPNFEEADKVTDKRELMKQARTEDPRRLQLVCLKNRYGIANFETPFTYWPAFDLFKEPEDKADGLQPWPDDLPTF